MSAGKAPDPIISASGRNEKYLSILGDSEFFPLKLFPKCRKIIRERAAVSFHHASLSEESILDLPKQVNHAVCIKKQDRNC